MLYDVYIIFPKVKKNYKVTFNHIIEVLFGVLAILSFNLGKILVLYMCISFVVSRKQV